MKISKKLISAIVMLTLSFVMLVTSSFAWFSMNDTVSVTGMQVTAKGDQIYLQIKEGKNASFEANAAQNSVAVASNSATYVPTNVYASITGSTVVGYVSGETFVWVTANSDDPTKSGKEDDNTPKYKEVASGSLSSYAYKTEYTLRLDPNAGGTNANQLWASVSLSEAYSDPIANSVSVLIKCYDPVNAEDYKVMLFKQENGTTKTALKEVAGDEYLTAAAFPDDGTIVNVEVYVFFDGDNLNCKTANVTKNAYSVNVDFSVLTKA
jgi:hypothetical protein